MAQKKKGSSKKKVATPKVKEEGRGSKAKYTNKQRRQAKHVYDSCKERGYKERDAERVAWATVNKIHGGGKKKKSSS